MDEGVFKPGDLCDRYRIARLIASGGAGEVYEAVHDFTGRTVALKCLQLRHSKRADLQNRMRMEAIVLCKIRHANVVMVHDAGVADPGIVWIAMERLVGKTLRQLLQSGVRFSVPQALYLASGVADGVEAAHELHVIHRDLKPENVFVTESSEIKVLDLGTAKFHGYGLKSTERMRTIGTPAYMSPEHLRGQPVDARSDVYALGLILYEMLAGRHPFLQASGDPMPDVYDLGAMQLFAEPTPLTGLVAGFPDYVWQIVRRALAKDRDGRYGSMTELANDLRAARHRFVREAEARDAGAPLPSVVVAPPMSGQPAPPASIASHPVTRQSGNTLRIAPGAPSGPPSAGAQQPGSAAPFAAAPQPPVALQAPVAPQAPFASPPPVQPPVHGAPPMAVPSSAAPAPPAEAPLARPAVAPPATPPPGSMRPCAAPPPSAPPSATPARSAPVVSSSEAGSSSPGPGFYLRAAALGVALGLPAAVVVFFLSRPRPALSGSAAFPPAVAASTPSASAPAGLETLLPASAPPVAFPIDPASSHPAASPSAVPEPAPSSPAAPEPAASAAPPADSATAKASAHRAPPGTPPPRPAEGASAKPSPPRVPKGREAMPASGL